MKSLIAFMPFNGTISEARPQIYCILILRLDFLRKKKKSLCTFASHANVDINELKGILIGVFRKINK